jgi:type I restriction enzyme S subunit
MKQGDALSLPKGWEIKKLGEVCNFKSGTTISPSLEIEVGDILYVKVGDMNLPENEIEINTSSRFVNSNEIKLAQIIPEGAVIFPKRGGAIATNKKRKVIQPTIVDLNTMAIIPTNKLDSEYFYYWFQMIDLHEISNGTTIPQINNYSFDEIFIQYPKSLPEQQRIVSILEEALTDIAKAKANAEQNLKNAKELFESYLQGVFERKSELGLNELEDYKIAKKDKNEILQSNNPKNHNSDKGDGWEEKKWGELCDFVRGPFGGSLKKNVFKENGYVVYEQKHAIHDHFNQLRYFIDEQKFNEMKRFEVFPGDIIMSCSGVTLGRVAVVPDGIPKGIINQALLKLTPKKNVSVHFIKHWLRSSIFQKIIFDYSGGAAIPNVPSAKILKDIKIPYPSLKEQERIVCEIETVLNETKRLEEIYKNKIDDLDELKKSILQKAFAGELKTEKVELT